MKMSKEDSPGPTVCENFEPQAWRKTVCKNCFQPPEVHVAGSGENGVSNTSGTENKSGDNVVEKKAAATSLKNKFEQLEKDKYKPKDVSSNTLPRTKKASGLSLITEKYDQLDRQAGKLESPTKGIPPPTPPKTYKKDGSMKSKFGSMENVSAPDIVESTSDNKLSAKFKFGSMENISNVGDKKKDSMVMTITQKKNIGSSMENISSADNMMDSRQAMLSKLDSFQNEVKSGAMSAAGQTVIHKQKDGNVEIITLPKTPIDKPKDSKLIPIDSPMKVNEKTEPKAKFEKPELKSNNKENGLSKVGQSKFDLKSKSNEADNKQSELKSAKDLLSTNKLKSTKADDTNDKPTDKDAKDTKSGWKRPELKSANKEKEEIKPTSLKDRLSKPGDRLKTEEPSKAGLSLKDQLKSPTTEKDKDPLAKLKDKLKSPTTETDNKQAPSWKDRLKSSSSDSDKKTETKQSADLKLKTTTKIESDKVKSPLSNDKKEVADDKKLSRSDTKKVTEVDKKSSVSVDKKVDTSLKDKEAVDKSQSSSKLDIKGKIGSSDKSSLENGAKSQEKNPPNDLKSKFNKPGLNSTKDDDTNSKAKPFDLRNNLKKKTDIPATDKDAGKSDTKAKIELPSFKSNKLTSLKDKGKETDSKVDDAKPSDKIGNKFEPKFKLNKTNEPKPSVVEEKTTGKAKFELPKLKSKSDPREETKSKFEPKSKINDIKTDNKNKFEIPSLKKTKSPEPKNDKDTPVKSNDSKDASTKDKNTVDTKILNESKNDNTKDSKSSFKVGDKETKVDTKVSPKDTTNTDKDKLDKSNEADKTTKNGATSKGTESVDGFQTNSETNKKESRIADTNKTTEVSTENNNTPVTSNISVTTSFENISSDSEVISGDACAAETNSTRDTKSPLHVDTQVFTSSRSKTAGVSSLNDSKFDDNSTTGFSALGINKSNNKSTKPPPKDTLLNGDIVLEHFNESSSKDEKMDNEKTIVSNYSDIELEKMKAELLNMTERCQNLETENEILRGDLNKKAVHESSIKKQREEVESAINGLRGQLKSMEDKCSQLESENLNMMNDLKAKHEINHSKPHTKETDEIDEKLTAKEKFTEDLMEENDQLKQEINELKMEMEEMYDSFRDQEAEEFREIQKELEYTAKNCRILQFKLRKMERRNEQTEQDKNTFEERLRKLQNSFQDRDAVSHIHSLEDELRLAKEVSVRLHDELDLMEDRRGKVEEENRHLTELLEQADRKQFRLELEVDKLRDKVVELRQELRLREGGADPAENRKLNCAEFLALHRETL